MNTYNPIRAYHPPRVSERDELCDSALRSLGILRKKCERCGGTQAAEQDVWGVIEASCLMCGRRTTLLIKPSKLT